jgi:hypothetical protein
MAHLLTAPVWTQALTAAPARLLGQELVLDKKDEGRHGLSSEVDVSYCVGDAKILYPVRTQCCIIIRELVSTVQDKLLGVCMQHMSAGYMTNCLCIEICNGVERPNVPCSIPWLQKCDTGVFPPSGFDPRLADRSRLPPSAHMWLEHVYGYAGMDTLQTNVWYTANTSK